MIIYRYYGYLLIMHNRPIAISPIIDASAVVLPKQQEDETDVVRIIIESS